MAIRTNMRSTATVILEMDDAIKAEPGAWSKYVEAGFNEALLKLQGEPTRFEMQRMTYDQRQHALDMTSAPARREFIIRCTLLSVRSYERTNDKGIATSLSKVKHEDSQQWQRPVVEAEWLKQADFPTPVMVGLAAIGLMLSEGAIPFCKASAQPSTATGTGASNQPQAS